MQETFFVPEQGGYRATVNTRGPWHPDFQHAGPPSALLAYGIEQQANGMQVVRLGVDLLKPVPIARLDMEVVERDGGKRRRILEASLLDSASGQVVARAQALLLSGRDIDLGPLPLNDPAPPGEPVAGQPFEFGFFNSDQGYHKAMDMRLEAGGPGEGHSRMWMRQRIPLLPDQQPSGLQRVMTVADSGNGVSMAIDPREYSFLNPDLTVSLRRQPRGEWLCLDAVTHFHGDGIGMAQSQIWDREGVVACGVQNLLIQPRE